MNTMASGAPDAFAVRRVVDGAWMPGSPSWSPNGTVMTFTPIAPWDATSSFEVLVNVSAKDDSDPGNTFAAPLAWQFTTGTGSDTIAPVITNEVASPALAEIGAAVTIRADVTDDGEIWDVNAHVQGPSTNVNLTMSLSAGTWTAARTYSASGLYSFDVWAIDRAGNPAFKTGSFSVRDRIAPVIGPVAALPTSATPNGAVNITGDVTDDTGLAGVKAHVTGPAFDVNLTMVHGTGSLWYVNQTYANPGIYSFTVWAQDGSGNVASRSGSFTIAEAPRPPAPSGVTAAAQADGTIRVSWASGTGGGIVGYHVYRSTSAGGPFTRLTASPLPATGPFVYVDSNVQPGTTYFYTVTAVDGPGTESPPSTSASATSSGGTSSLGASTLWIALGVVGAVVLGVGILVWRRRKP